jgi:hypothetical protein
MEHDLRIGQDEPLAFGAGHQQDGRPARRLADAVRCHLTPHELHRVVDRQRLIHQTARRVDIQMDILRPLDGLKVEQLLNHRAGDPVNDRTGQKDDPVLQQHVRQGHLPRSLVRRILIERRHRTESLHVGFLLLPRRDLQARVGGRPGSPVAPSRFGDQAVALFDRASLFVGRKSRLQWFSASSTIAGHGASAEAGETTSACQSFIGPTSSAWMVESKIKEKSQCLECTPVGWTFCLTSRTSPGFLSCSSW